ncbi:MAG TPA: hypothetical protein VMT30_01270 [Candidatus Saccharimonadia bacterium]|nr:hypothetical protein [Candidatus Saccharimonadia bacterium]
MRRVHRLGVVGLLIVALAPAAAACGSGIKVHETGTVVRAEMRDPKVHDGVCRFWLKPDGHAEHWSVYYPAGSFCTTPMDGYVLYGVDTLQLDYSSWGTSVKRDVVGGSDRDPVCRVETTYQQPGDEGVVSKSYFDQALCDGLPDREPVAGRLIKTLQAVATTPTST